MEPPQRGSLFRLNLTNESREAVADSHGRLLILGPPLTSKEMRVRLKALDSENPSNDRLFSLTPEEINIPTVRIVLILLSPTDFMILAPGSKADMVIEKIVKKYQEEMGRVRHRLSLNVGCLHFRDRFPLYLAIDTARRQMARLERARGDKDILRMQCATATWNLKDKTLQIMNYPVGPGSSFIHILEQKFGAILSMEDVPKTIRDGINKQVEIVEPFYPYLRIESYPNTIPSNIANSGYQHPVHFNGKKIYLYPSLFSHLVLDRFQRRLEFDTIPDNDMQTPLATLQIPLEAWDQLKGLENYLFDHGISKSQRKAMLEECLRIVLSWKEVPGNTPTVDIANHQDHYIASLFHQLLGVDKWQNLEPGIRQKLGSSWRNNLLFWAAQLGELCRPDA